MKKFYITTPLYYVNSSPHIGHSYTQIACDVLARFNRISGYEVFFMTGTDEHGEKIEEAALAAGFAKGGEKKFVDSVVPTFKDLWKKLDISHDHFIRTTDKEHEETVKAVLEMMKKAGDIYKGTYSGWFCTPCETFWTDTQVEGSACPDCKRPLDRVEEDNYFFKLSKHQEWLIEHIKKNDDFIRPDYRRNEILSFLRQPLNDLCVSRPKGRMAWGIEIPFDKDYVTYVWFDALINYISGVGFSNDKKKFAKLWPCDLHVIGKDILRHHAVYWPIMLRAIGVKPPKTIFAHGWWTIKGEKMSKSKGNIVDPRNVIAEYGVDAYRYFLLREVSFGLDGTFSEQAIISRFNSDLANDLGNLVNRSLTMVEKYFGGEIQKTEDRRQKTELKTLSDDLINNAKGLGGDLQKFIAGLDFSGALSRIWVLINKANKYIEDSAPWKYAKAGDEASLRCIIYNLLEVLRIVAVSVYPFMPEASHKIWGQLGLKGDIEKSDIKAVEKWGLLKPGTKIEKAKPLFPRIQ